MWHKRLFFFYVIFSVAFLASCSVSTTTSFNDAEGRIPDDFFYEIRRGKTTEHWIESQLGKPLIVQQGPGSKQISTYRLTRAHKKHADLLVLLRYNGEKREVEYFHVFYEEAVVRRHWRDAFSEVQVDRYFGKPKKNKAEIKAVDTPPSTTPIPEGVPENYSDQSLMPQPIIEQKGISL
ncbi:hypothetical protein [Teredinibacter haidensis]|uniref:hypothetical protein n=1 Tax=Teredinibacter haidensis TaxID=2731755 RepID=UPI000948A473|nr:hypothetical protein [Teredinibacter haidensis]